MIGVGVREIMIIFLGTFVQEVLMIADNVKSVPKDMINVAYFRYSNGKSSGVVLPYRFPASWIPSSNHRLGVDIPVVAELVAPIRGWAIASWRLSAIWQPI